MVVVRDIGTDAVSIAADIVSSGNYWAVMTLQLRSNKRYFCSFQRIQTVETFYFDSIAMQQVERWARPDVCFHAEVGFQQFGTGNDFLQDGTGTHQLNFLVAFSTGFQQVHTFQDVLFHAFRHVRMSVVLVHQGDVVEHVFVVGIHTAQTVLYDNGYFVLEGRIVRNAVRDQIGLNVTVAVFVLQAFTVQCCTAGSTTQQEAACVHIAGSPCQIADTLETEHRVVNVERNHGKVVVCVAGRSSNRTWFVNTFLQDLTVNRLFIEHQLVFILRGVLLTFRVPNTILAEHTFHTESTAFVRNNRYNAFADFFVFQQSRQDAYESHGG